MTFDHVAGQSPRRGGKAEDGNIGTSVFHRAAKGFYQEASFDFGVEEVEFFHVGFSANRFGEVWTFVLEFESEAHGFGRDENVRKDNDGINVEATQRLDGDLECQIGSFANFQKRMFCADFAVFGKIAAGLAHHPDGEARNGLAAAGAQEKLLAGERVGLGRHVHV